MSTISLDEFEEIEAYIDAMPKIKPFRDRRGKEYYMYKYNKAKEMYEPESYKWGQDK